MEKDEALLSSSINKVKAYTSINLKKNATFKDLGDIANYNGMNFYNWAQGKYSPKSVISTFKILASLTDEQIIDIINDWRSRA
ncbi:hypothetical protein [Nitrosophilus labii]|uniref:hypothetical protein n=1 Tax=Nitrosophilus labii TaxID=2706014 RepID=UPI0016575BE9|nr:hypothetical protein [Nitrosophilus labii]